MLALTLWLVAFVLALSLDGRVAKALVDHPVLNKNARTTTVLKWPGGFHSTVIVNWVEVVKTPGDFKFTLVVALALFVLNRYRLRAAVSLLLSGMLGGLLYSVIKWLAGRRRPLLAIDPWGFHPFPGGFAGMFTRGGLSFPSGHACLSFATATTLALAVPRWRWLWFSLAAIVAAERVLENAHYLSDVVAGAGIGVLCGWIMWKAIESRRWFEGWAVPTTR